MSSAAPLSPVRFPVLLLCVTLPLAVCWWWPYNLGASIEAFPVLLGLLAAGVIGTAGLGSVSRGLLIWLGVVIVALMLRGSSLPLYNLMLLPLALAAWIGFALGGAAFRDARVARAVGLGLALGVAINLLAGLVQYFHLDPYFQPWVTRGGLSERIYGNTRQPNHFGMLMTLSLALLWWLAARRLLSPGRTFFLTVLVCLGTALSGSRIAVVAAFAVTLMALVWRGGMDRKAMTAFVVAPVLVLVMSWGLGGLSSSSDSRAVSVVERGSETVSMRVFHWQATLEMIEAEPWLGVGWREYRPARFAMHPEHAAVEVVEHAHNVFLHLAAELGIPLMLVITVPVLVFIVRRRPWAERDPTVQAAWMVLLLILLYSQVEFPLWVMNFLLLACIAAGVISAAGRTESTSDPVGRGAGAGDMAVPRGLAWLLVVGTLLAMVDYDRASASSGAATTFDWGRTEEEKLGQSQKSVLFGLYADRSLFRSGRSLTVNEQTYRPLLELTDRLMHFGPHPQLLSARIMAYCEGRDYENLEKTVKVYQRAFPAALSDFAQSLSPETAQRCRVAGLRAQKEFLPSAKS